MPTESQETITERVRKVRRFETQRELFYALPTWNNEIFCLHCNEFTDHLELGFDTKEDWPLLVFCEKCALVTFDKFALTVQERVRQIREWRQWANKTGGPGPTEVWLFLLPGVPAEKTETTGAG